MATLADLAASTDVLPLALRWCNGTSLATLRESARDMAELVPHSSPLWDSLLRRYTAWLHQPQVPGVDATNSAMVKSIRLGHAVDRCNLKLSRDVTEGPQGHVLRLQRHSLVVTGARRSGISTLVHMLVHKFPDSQISSSQDMMVHRFRAELGGSGVVARVVDKRSTVISTPLSASLYKGPTACLFVFDGGRMVETLTEAAWCIEELQQTVGPEKFKSMPKLLVCHKADLLPLPAMVQSVPDAPLGVASLPPMCRHLISVYQMDLVLTTKDDQNSVDLAFALAAEQWPQESPDDHVEARVPPVGSEISEVYASLRPITPRITRHAVVSAMIQPGNRRSGGFFEELHALDRLALARG